MGDRRDGGDRGAAIARLLDGLDEAHRRHVIDVCTPRHFRRGEPLFQEGDPGESLHFLTRGFVVVQVTTPSGETATMNVLRAPDSFGELALIDPSGRRSASVIALTTVETLALDRSSFERLRAEQPALEHVLVKILQGEVRRLSARLVEALYVPAETRVLLRLADLVQVFGDGAPGTVVPVTQSDLAALAGTTRPTVNRVLQVAQSVGSISIGRGRVAQYLARRHS